MFLFDICSPEYRAHFSLSFRYLQEIGYIDKVVELRSARVKMLLGLTSEAPNAVGNEQPEITPPFQLHPAVKSIATKNSEQIIQGQYEENEEEIAVEDEVDRKGKPVIQ